MAALGVMAAAVTAVLSAPSILAHIRIDKTAIRALRAKLAGAEYLGTDGVVLQAKRYDCGAASLKMILHARGVERPLVLLEREAATTASGATIAGLRMAAEHEGVPSKAWVLSAADLRHAPLPVIAFVDGDHYVVIRGFAADGRIEIDDPALGKTLWTPKAFARAWRGETVVFDPRWDPIHSNTSIVLRAQHNNPNPSLKE